ncbi:MAG: glycosyl transferase [Xenococcus sp. MO_188.B8]|nr:glycosyl transferase [Xenococcus sp. MO_188.B8]
MSQPKLYIAITSHGFGHAVRAASVADKIQQLCPEISIIFATTAPQWLLRSYVSGDFMYRPRVFDVGVVQSDSLTMDKKTTLEKMQEIRAQQEQLIAEEVEFIRQHDVQLILGDIPPLVTAIAEAAGIPCWMMSNFGWDFIYGAWGDSFTEIINWIKECYGKCDRLFRLPLSEPMTAFPQITDVGLTGGTPRYSEEELRDKFAITAPPEKIVLLTFGGLGLQAIPYENLKHFPDWDFITFDRQAPDLPNLKIVANNFFRPVDFMLLCSRIISKPGYSTFAEALRLELPIVTLTREDFAEAPILLKSIQDHSKHQIVTTEEFFQGSWNFLTQPLIAPKTDIKLPKDGSETIAQEIIKFMINN